ncbi:MAG: response regulator transcription factor [Desulfatiglandales bacterium]
MKKKSLLIVDDHPMVREGLKVIIERNSRFEVVGEAGSAAEGFRIAEKLKPDLVIVDISLPDGSGIDLIRRMKTAAIPEASFLVVSMHSKIDYITEAYKAGATGYLVKESAPDALIKALETIVKGEYYLDTYLAPSVVETLKKSPGKDREINDDAYRSLTNREQEIMRMLAKDISVKEIADRLFISPKTVENHRTNIKGKLGLKSTIDLARYAARLGLIDVDEWKG